ncbi:MAG: spore germination protein [Oscillospiraceae bacterium]|nr:spore germination protein [Oscillospiraceae bacterium]
MSLPVSSEAVKKVFENCGDLEVRTVRPGGGAVKAVLCYLDGLADVRAVGRDIIRPLTEKERFDGAVGEGEIVRRLLDGALFSVPCRERRSMAELAGDILRGGCALIFDGVGVACSYEVKNRIGRGVDKPENEKAIKGAKDSFCETYRLNTALVRARLRSAEVKIYECFVGRRSDTKVGLVYIEGLTSAEFVKEAKKRLSQIDIDGLLTTGDIEEYMTGAGPTPFPQMLITERPDKFCMGLLEGRVGIMADGLPCGLMLPAVIGEFIKVPDDNAEHFMTASLVTLLRFAAAALSLIIPALYVAVTMYHQGMMPTKLILSVIRSRRDVPFSTMGEVLSMLVAFELLQEAGLRLPKSIGETVSIIGALIVGQSAVEAKLLSPAVVIVVALAGITGYTMPDQDMAAALRLCRLALTVLAVISGMFGIVAGVIMIILHLSSLETFGVPYTAPFSEGNAREILQTLLRFPLKSVKYRKAYMRTRDRRKQK